MRDSVSNSKSTCQSVSANEWQSVISSGREVKQREREAARRSIISLVIFAFILHISYGQFRAKESLFAI